jgi:hypothetical protein
MKFLYINHNHSKIKNILSYQAILGLKPHQAALLKVISKTGRPPQANAGRDSKKTQIRVRAVNEEKQTR